MDISRLIPLQARRKTQFLQNYQFNPTLYNQLVASDRIQEAQHLLTLVQNVVSAASELLVVVDQIADVPSVPSKEELFGREISKASNDYLFQPDPNDTWRLQHSVELEGLKWQVKTKPLPLLTQAAIIKGTLQGGWTAKEIRKEVESQLKLLNWDCGPEQTAFLSQTIYACPYTRVEGRYFWHRCHEEPELFEPDTLDLIPQIVPKILAIRTNFKTHLGGFPGCSIYETMAILDKQGLFSNVVPLELFANTVEDFLKVNSQYNPQAQRYFLSCNTEKNS